MIRFLIISILFICANSVALGYEIWNQKEQLPAVGRHRGTGIAIGDKGYVGLGHMNGTGNNIIYQDWWEFDPATNSWTQKSNFPAMTYGAAAFSVGNFGYVGGGTGLFNEFFKFNPINNMWTPIADCLNESPSDDTAFGIDEKGYVKSGNTFVEYNPENDSWTLKADCPLGGWAITSFVIDGKGYVKSGLELYEYKPANDEWVERAPYPGLTSNGGPGFSILNKGYIVSGYSGFLNPVNSECWEFDPANNSWSQVSDFPGVSRRFGVAFSINNKGYFGLGTNGTNFNDFWEFDPLLEGLTVNNTDFSDLKVYPNPSNDFICFEFKNSIGYNANLMIYSELGVLIDIVAINSGVQTLSKMNFEKGIYFYKLLNDTELLTTGKFIFN